MSALEFLSPSAAAATNGHEPIARSPMERLAQNSGARFEDRGGWRVAIGYPDEAGALERVAWADVSHLPKWELDAVAGQFGTARRDGDAWLCPLTPTRALQIGDAAAPAGGLDVTCNYAALTILGPLARETIARFCAIDLRPEITPAGGFRPGSVGRQPGMILCEAPDRFLVLFGWAVAEYMWTVVEDAGKRLGGGPVGVDGLSTIEAPEAGARA